MPQLTSERLVLSGGTLRVFCRADKAMLTIALRQRGSAFSVAVPVIRSGQEYFSQFSLAELANNRTYEIVARGVGGERRMGKRIAALQGLLAKPQRSASLRVLAASSFTADGRSVRAWLVLDVGSDTVFLRLSERDDMEECVAASVTVAPKPSPAPERFSVVSAVYNVEKYLDDYFRSLTSQTIDFRSRLELILVDDGSTDHSAKIIRRWQRKYPGNIRYVYQPNGGVASARNAGLALATSDWVTFMDPDDFVSPTYFASVADAIARHRDSIVLVSCKVIVFSDEVGKEIDSHSLRFRFASGERLVPAGDLGRDIQLSVNSAFLRRDLVIRSQVKFDGRVRPTTEDAHFVARYLMDAGEANVLFLPSAKYLYRKRATRDSLVDVAGRDPRAYADKLEYGYLDLLRISRQRFGVAPAYIQYGAIYDVMWHLRPAVDGRATLSFLTDTQRQRYGDLLAAIFAFVDDERLMDYNVTPLPFSYRIGILNLFKDRDPPGQVAEINRYDSAGQLVRVVCWTRRRESGAEFLVDGRHVQPAYTKRRRVDFLGAVFVWEHIAWVPLDDAETLTVTVEGRPAELMIDGKEAKGKVDGRRIQAMLARPGLQEAAAPEHVRQLLKAARSPQARARFKDAWLFMDRDSTADDSAEHLYRYVRRVAPEINAYFILRRDSPDWRRLAEEGFRLLAFAEIEHGIALLHAAYLISSQCGHFVERYLGRTEFGDLLKFKFVFLQHGVIKDDMSSWLNGVRIDCFVTSTPAEFASIVGDGSPYRLTEKEVVLTGLPRFDALLAEPDAPARTLAIMPTWRASLTGPSKGPGSARSVDSAFFASDFAKRWKRFLHAPELKQMAERAGWDVVFLSHPNLEPYLAHFEAPDWMTVRRFGDGHRIASLLRGLAAMVTDYSSVAFNAAYLGKPVVYYQFDADVFFNTSSQVDTPTVTRRGYFDYERDGFGPVCGEEADVWAAIEAVAQGAINPVYEARAARTFPFRDGRCCERTFQAILALEAPLEQIEMARCSAL